MRDCGKHVKLSKQERDRLSNSALSHRPQWSRCKSSGGSSGKSNNGGAAPRFEQGGRFGNPGRRLPHHVEAESL